MTLNLVPSNVSCYYCWHMINTDLIIKLRSKTNFYFTQNLQKCNL